MVSGDDINNFELEPDELLIDATQQGAELTFTFIRGSLGSASFTSDGLFGNDTHTLEDGSISAAPFIVELEPDGSYFVPVCSQYSSAVSGDLTAGGRGSR